jgi:hypothetical protein
MQFSVPVWLSSSKAALSLAEPSRSGWGKRRAKRAIQMANGKSQMANGNTFEVRLLPFAI